MRKSNLESRREPETFFSHGVVNPRPIIFAGDSMHKHTGALFFCLVLLCRDNRTPLSENRFELPLCLL